MAALLLLTKTRRAAGLALAAAAALSLLGCAAAGQRVGQVETLRQAVVALDAEVDAAGVRIDKIETRVQTIVTASASATVGGSNDNITTWLAVGGSTILAYVAGVRPMRIMLTEWVKRRRDATGATKREGGETC